ncbi:unnamed protein product [Effrenium voratum]|uniref:RING-type domain-containing protein n=1 Tax=Effrenium voratum TaxID=2562239 RepID=A0AA36MR94_9DINO|nr:unnamed protein product [Effrenium voratum]
MALNWSIAAGCGLALIFWILLILVSWWRTLHQRPQISTSTAIDLPELAVQHLDHEQICAVCMELAPPGTPLAELSCSHAFYGDCVLKWWLRSGGRPQCPLCRCEHNLPFA